VIYDIRHVTTYRYDDSVASARCTLRLLPRAQEGQEGRAELGEGGEGEAEGAPGTAASALPVRLA
jgi:hypothetical protein